MLHVDTTSFFLIVLSAAVAATTVVLLPKRVAPPVVVLELALGILIGPHGFELASTDEFSLFFANLGLGMLFYFAGYEINF
ncbi:MAG TPA: cation:proton antiporter, partial [Solirubrobacterales bacterium]